MSVVSKSEADKVRDRVFDILSNIHRPNNHDYTKEVNDLLDQLSRKKHFRFFNELSEGEQISIGTDAKVELKARIKKNKAKKNTQDKISQFWKNYITWDVSQSDDYREWTKAEYEYIFEKVKDMSSLFEASKELKRTPEAIQLAMYAAYLEINPGINYTMFPASKRNEIYSIALKIYGNGSETELIPIVENIRQELRKMESGK